MKEEQPLVNSDAFDIAIDNFLSHIESLWKALPNVLRTIENYQAGAVNKYNSFLTTECEYSEADSNYIIKAEKSIKFKALKKDANNSILASVIIKRNFVVSLISQFDMYIGSLIRCIFITRPELIDNSEKQLTYNQLKTFDSIEDAKEYIIEKEIETVLRESHTEQFRWFEKKLGVNLLKDLPIWSTFIEVTQRRNLFVHTNGIVSTQYLNVCKENNVQLSNDLKVGDVLDVELGYFEIAFACLFEIGFKLNQVLRRHLLPNEIQRADSSFLNITFELIANRQYLLSKELHDFAEKYIKKYSSNDLQLRIKLNRAQTYKWLNQKEKCIEIVDAIDWSASGDMFRLAAFVLKDDFENAASIMKNINPAAMTESNYNDWPIFREFRKSQEFKTAYKDVYEKDYEVVNE